MDEFDNEELLLCSASIVVSVLFPFSIDDDDDDDNEQQQQRMVMAVDDDNYADDDDDGTEPEDRSIVTAIY